MANVLTVADGGWDEWGGLLPGEFIYPTDATGLLRRAQAQTVFTQDNGKLKIVSDYPSDGTNKMLWGPNVAFTPMTEFYLNIKMTVDSYTSATAPSWSYTSNPIVISLWSSAKATASHGPQSYGASSTGQGFWHPGEFIVSVRPNVSGGWQFDTSSGHWSAGAGGSAGLGSVTYDGVSVSGHTSYVGPSNRVFAYGEYAELHVRVKLFDATTSPALGWEHEYFIPEDSCDAKFYDDHGGMSGTHPAVDNLGIFTTTETSTAHIEHIVINSTVGSQFTGTCGALSPVGSFQGDITGTGGFTVAPEKLPHIITAQDVGGNLSLAKKLQDNFDSIERQLLALDPDSNTEYPYR